MASDNDRIRQTGRTKNEFGTFGGVFTPAILTILGVIMFMRANFVVGHAGVLGAIIILVVAKSITLTTSFSIAAISTNMQVRGGGSYFLISRALGVEFGGAIGIALFLALALSVPFYILGFTEALVKNYHALIPHFQTITLSSATILFLLAYFGAGWAIRTQYVIMLILAMAIIAFLGGALQIFSTDTFLSNLHAGYGPVDPQTPAGPHFTFWVLFAIYFPAVTGIDAGVNMSGDLRDPGRSIPRGTLAAVGVGFSIYLAEILLSGGAHQRTDLISMPYELLRDNALLGMGFFVSLGVIAATLSSALGSYLGAPRVLQAVSRDRIIRLLRPFARGTAKGDEPRRALILTYVITIAVLLWAGDAGGGGALNAIAAIITMFFLYTYGMINVAAFIEAFGHNPSFRPRYKLFHWGIALAGSIGCIAVAVLINWLAALAAIVLIAMLLWYLKAQHLAAKFGDARRGFVYSAARKNLLRLERMEDSPKNWRPTVLVFSGRPADREALVTYAVWMENNRGMVILAHVLVGEFDELVRHRHAALRQLSQFCDEKNIEAFPTVVVSDTVDQGVFMLLQTAAIGPIRPNLAVFGWSQDPAQTDIFMNHLRTASSLGMSLVLIRAETIPDPESHKRIDVWWRGQKNGALMLLLAYLLASNWEWEDTEIRILRIVENEAGLQPAREALEELIKTARVTAHVEVIASRRPFAHILQETSAEATCVVLGFEVPDEEKERHWYATYQSCMLDGPAMIIVNSRDGEDLLM